MQNPISAKSAAFTGAGFLLGTLIGVLIGRTFPAHHYEKFGVETLVIDTATGRVCDAIKRYRDPEPEIVVTTPSGRSTATDTKDVNPLDKINFTDDHDTRLPEAPAGAPPFCGQR